MIKNKDGSYNKFKLLIILLIFIITISITGVYILQNVKLPKIETPSWTTPVPTSTTTPSPTIIPIDPKIAVLYNSTNITYTNTTSWNWSYTNFSNSSNWTYPPEMISNYTFIVGAGGSGGSGSSANISYAIVAGGGGGGAGYTSVAYINSTPVAPVIQVTPQETFNSSQNISQALVQAFNPLGESWLVYLIIIVPMVMMMSMIRGRSLSMLLPVVIGLIVFGYFFNIGTMPLLVIIGIIPMIIIMSSMLSDR